jgi:hypothetical protein
MKHSSIITKHEIAYVSIYFHMSKTQFVSNGFNILQINGLTHVDN